MYLGGDSNNKNKNNNVQRSQIIIKKKKNITSPPDAPNNAQEVNMSSSGVSTSNEGSHCLPVRQNSRRPPCGFAFTGSAAEWNRDRTIWYLLADRPELPRFERERKGKVRKGKAHDRLLLSTHYYMHPYQNATHRAKILLFPRNLESQARRDRARPPAQAH